jgi:TonB family protein
MTLVLETTVKVSVILALTLLATVAVRRQSAALRHWLLSVGLTCAATAPVLGLLLPAWHPPSFVSRPTELLEVPSSSRVVDAVATEPQDEVAIASVGLAPSDSHGVSAARLLGTIWLVGAGFSLALLTAGLARLARVASRATPVEGGPWVALAEDIAHVYGLRRRVLVLQSDHPSLLATWGFVRPAVILPRGASAWSDDRARIVLSHELAHVRRSDWLVLMVAELLRSIYWFNPLLWVASRRLRDESERACDDAVLSAGIDGSDYAAELLELARTLRAHGGHWLPAPAMARASSLEGRVAAMLNAHLNRRPLAKSAKLATGAAVVALALVVAAFSASAQTFASFSGSVLDPIGGTVAGVALNMTNKQTGQKYEVKSSDVGSFEFVGLTAGEYDLRTTMPGFRQTLGTMTIGAKNVRNDIRLKVGSLEETISVVSTAESRQNASSTPQVRRAPPSVQKSDCVVQPTGGVLAPPRKIADVRPISPGQAGLVVLDALIAPDGTVTDARPVDVNVDPSLAAAAVEAVRQWQYTPTLLNCVPIEVPMKVTVSFRVE